MVSFCFWFLFCVLFLVLLLIVSGFCFVLLFCLFVSNFVLVGLYFFWLQGKQFFQNFASGCGQREGAASAVAPEPPN